MMSCDKKLSADGTRENIMLSTVVYGICFANPDTILMFKIYFGVFGEGTRLAMPDSSSLKPGSGATEGVLD